MQTTLLMDTTTGSYKMRQKLILLLASLAIFPCATAQEYRFEAGVAAGISGYLGDVNQSNVVKNPGFSGSLLFRYLINKRFAVKIDATTAGISGNSADFTNMFPDGQQYSFSERYYDVAAAFEFNFLNFGMNDDYRKLKRITPYLSLGFGAAYSSSGSFVPHIPISIGAKYKLARQWNLGLEVRARMMLNDKVDGLSDLYNIDSSFMKNTDWCPTLMVSVSYEFGEICKICHYVE